MTYNTDRDAGFDDMLDAVYGTIQIAGMSFDTAEALYRLDPIAYRVGVSEYHDSQCEDGEHDYRPRKANTTACYWCGDVTEDE